MANQKRFFSVSTLITILLLLLTVSMLIFPSIKATFLRSLMAIGLFQPNVETKAVSTQPPKTWNVHFTSSKGEQIDSNTLKNKIVFINIWATWCPPCIAEMPSINELYKSYQSSSDIVFIMADADNNQEKAAAFMSRKNYVLPVHITADNLPAEWFDGSLPTTLVIDKSGQIVFHHTGMSDYNSGKFKTFLNELIATK